MPKEATKHLYIVLSQTGTILSRILKFATGAEYNHSSISLSADLTQMYSFGRRNPYNPFWGGFIKESPNTGTFKRFQGTKVIIFAVEIDEKHFIEVRKTLQKMYSQQGNYHYNYLGLFLAALRICRRKENCYYCSEFVRQILSIGKVSGVERLDSIVHPIHFLSLPHKEIFCGRLIEYFEK